ncbi:hypothetical protein F5B22DRAFT_150838 [Xylaria bambusicola]|uniref:uncharacterized protein n=1 Tax=Xylaria bambusicola TaxID=326684 RepID=UPI002007C899|nr:uncharacterized protein F5B22DRAFT_150838 [Xylaria bambusicola]KAI0526286.1 hypothetical protein F5B22DRAFT_150838 [Xylaria bambusicola]
MASPNNNRQLELTTIEADAVRKALHYWLSSKLVPSNLLNDLLATVQVVEEQHHSFDWDKFAKYTFRLAVICLTIAILSLIFDDVVPKIIKRILALPSPVRIAVTSALAIVTHIWGYQRSLVAPKQLYSNEAIHSLGALLFGLTAVQLVTALEADKKENVHIFHNIVLSLALVYGVSAALVQSTFIWSCGMIVFGIWFGTWTAYGSGTYYLGMNYPLRFVLFGAGLIAVSGYMRNLSLIATLWSPTRTWGMLYLFIALWILSLFGNDKLRGDNVLTHGGMGRVAIWSIGFLCAATAAIWHGLRYGDSTTKGFGLTFLGINLYTKFFEFCWSKWYKSVFFAVMALSLALVGRYAETVNVVLHEQYFSPSSQI